MIPNGIRVSQVLFQCSMQVQNSKISFISSRSLRSLAATCASSGYCLRNVEILLFVNFTIESIKESGMNRQKDPIGSATERAAFLGHGFCVAKCYFSEDCQICADYSLKLFPTLLENFLKNLNTQT